MNLTRRNIRPCYLVRNNKNLEEEMDNHLKDMIHDIAGL